MKGKCERKKTVDLCRSKWKNLRDTYRRLKREKTRSGDAGGVKPSKWPFLEQLQFLNATLDIPRTSSNITLEMLEEAMDSPAVICEVESFQQTEGEDGSGSSVASSSAFQGAPPCASGKKRKGYDYKLEVLKELRSTRPEPAKQHTQSELFCMSLAIEMNGLTEKKRRKLQAAIMNMLADIDDDN
ncbi:uncharacterized protein LOC134535983 isoform X2 [Bacillus rossius redtenbacheri]|uniref:uncharacterized protein LOC134535983 isoform X2 n=1 Tax=Bacillus rossius redtenbacheri TaxID=93214 RepID=UPI002FDD1C8A